MSETPKTRAEVVGLWAGTLAATEVGLGSILHGLHVPLAGTMLSLNQAAFLARATRSENNQTAARTLPMEISSITAILKSFSPVGKKLTPMLAITAQGALFSVATLIFGANLLGVIIGSAFLATWGVMQPVALAGLMFWALSNSEQEKIFLSWQKLAAELPFLSTQNISTAIAVFLTLKCVAAVIFAAAAWKLSPGQKISWFTAWVRQLTKVSATQRPLPAVSSDELSMKTSVNRLKDNPFTQAFKDLLNPLVIMSVTLLIVLALMVDSNLVATFWIGMRAIGAVYATYVILRWLPWDKVLHGDSASKTALRAAIKRLRAIQTNSPTQTPDILRQVRP
jgi:hypothetical protein